MKENLKKESSKNRKSNKIVIVLLSVVVLVCAAFAGLYASGILGVPTDTKPASEEIVAKASNVADRATLRELLLMDCELDITVTEDMEIKETLVVNGVKKVTSDKLLKASFQMEDGEVMLDVSKKASLTIDGWNLDGNGVAQGVHVNRNATFEHAAGKMEYMGTYGVVTEGNASLSKETEISHVGEGAFKVAIEGEMNVKGGKYTNGGNYLANVEGGGVLNISGEPLFDNAVNHLVYNYGETTINGGTFLNSGYRGVTNYAKMTMDYKGDKEDGYIEVGNTENVAVYTSSTFKVSYNGVYGHDAGANVFLQSHNGSRCYVENCTFDTGKGNAVSIRGEVYFTGVDIRNAGSSGVILQQNGVATFKDVQIDNSNGRGISVESATLLGEDIRISGTGGVGIAAQVYDDIGPAKVDVSNVHMSNIQGNSIKVINGGVMEFKDSVFEISKRTSVMADNGTIKLDGVKVLGNIDKDVNVVQVQPDGDLTISGKTLITGGVMRAVAVYGGKFTMNGGEIRDNSINETGAAVHITKNGKSVGVFTMNGGSICNNTTTNEIKNAGGVNVSNDAMFVMKGGKIYGNKTSGIGGGVRVAEGATFKMSGGEIYKNTSKQGGGVQVDKDATFTMTGGSIYQNETKASGAGVHVLGNFAISGGKIYQNKATSYGGAMNIASTTDNKTKKVTAAGVLTMTGGEIYGNSAVSGGGAIQVSGNTTANISGGKITNNETGGIGDGIRVSGKVTISGDCYVGNDKVALTSKDVKLKVTGKKLTQHSAKDPLLVAVADGVSTGHVVVECDDNDAAVSLITHTASGNGSYLLAQKDKNLVVNYAAADMDMTGADTVYVSNFAELKEAITSTTSKRYIVLGADIEMESTITVPNGTTVYIRDDGEQRILSRKDGKTSTFFNTRYGTGIYLVGTKAGNLVLDGEISADAKAENVKSLVTAQGGTIIDGVTFKNNGTEIKELLGAFIYQKYGHIDIYDSTFTGAKAGSGAVGIATMATGYAENCVFADNTVVNGGGAIRLEKNSEFKVKDSVFENNSAGTSGGAVVSESGTFTAIDCDFRNNTAGNDGGVIKSNGGTAKFLDEDGKQNVLTANTSGKAGGAVWAKGMLEIEEYAFESNHSGLKEAANGGAIYVEGRSTNATVTNGTFTDNESLSNCGGAINNAGATLTITNTIFDGNKTTASKKNGGAIYSNNNNASTTIISSEFKNNQAKDGGAIRVTAGTIEITDSVFASNSATENGGAICTTPSDGNSVVEVTVTGSELNGNYAYNGGVIYNGLSDGRASVVNTNECIFDSNYTTGNTGGAVYIQATYTDNGSTFQNNKACDAEGNVVKNGGALYIQDKVAIATLNDSIFKSNQAKTGGAIRITIGTMIANQCDFIENWCVGDDGGAINMEASKGKVEVTLNGDENHSSVFEGNVARWNGGAIRVGGTDHDSILKVTGYTFKDNKVGEKVGDTVNLAGTSGAISVTGKGRITTDSIDNIFNGNAAKNGGAIHYNTSNELNVSDWTFTDNSASYNGGAIYVNAGTVNLNEEGSFTGNVATNEGGAIYVSAGTLNVSSEDETGTKYTFTSNVSQQHGGAIRVAGGTADIYNTEFASNRSEANCGGAITTSKGILVENSVFDSNIAGDEEGNVNKNGGALYVNDANAVVTINNSNFTGNKAKTGGAIRITAGTINANQCNFTNNWSAGDDGGAINMDATGGAVTVNLIGDESNSYTFSNNTARWNGGAIRVGGTNHDSTLKIVGYKFENNKVGEKVGDTVTLAGTSGAISVTGKGSITTDSVDNIFTENAAETGGAIYYESSKILAAGDWTFTNNNATVNGGAIYVKGKAGFIVSKMNFEDNKAFGQGSTSGKGGALYIETTSTDGVSVTECDFAENRASGEAGAIYHNDGMLTVTDCNFTNNSAATYNSVTPRPEGFTNAGGNGGAIYIRGDADALITATVANTYSFTGNTAWRGSDGYIWGAIASNSTGDVRYSAKYTFSNNTHANQGDLAAGCGIHGEGKTLIRMDEADSYAALKTAVTNAGTKETTEITLLGNIEIGDSRIDVNSGQDVVIKNAKDVPVVISRTSSSASNMFNVNAGGKLKFMSNTEGGILTIDGKNIAKAAMLYGRGILELQGITVQNGNSTRGGAVQLRTNAAKLIVNDCLFASNVSTSDGGAISLVKENNTCPTAEINNTNFTGNGAATNGGAIFMEGGTVTLKGTGTYEANTATTAGGAIYVTAGNLNVSAVDVSGIQYNFKGNVATNNHGGAIHVAGGSANIYNAKFEANRSEKNCGGAIRSGANTLIQSCEFTGNIAGDKDGNAYANGGAIYINAGTTTIKYSDFTGNIAKDGGAIRITAGTANITECDFYQNHSKHRNASTQGHGGAINMSGSASAAPTVNLTGNANENNVFDGNTTQGYGGAINASYGNETLTIKNYTFTNNSAESGSPTRVVHNNTALTVDSTVVGW